MDRLDIYTREKIFKMSYILLFNDVINEMNLKFNHFLYTYYLEMSDTIWDTLYWKRHLKKHRKKLKFNKISIENLLLPEKIRKGL